MNLKDIIIKNNLWFIIIPIIITLAMLIPLKEARINPDLNEYLPAGMPSKKNLEQIEEVFGKTDPLLLIIESDDLLDKKCLERIKNISTEIGSMPEVRQIISLFDTKNIRGEKGFMIVEPAVNFIPENEIEKSFI